MDGMDGNGNTLGQAEGGQRGEEREEGRGDNFYDSLVFLFFLIQPVRRPIPLDR
jgi:hypothetical protein